MKDKTNKTIELSVNSSRREFVSKAVKASAFAVPMALGLETIAARKVHAQEQSTAESGGGGAQESTGGGGGGQESSAASVPEPAAVTLLGLGLASLALQARRKQKERSSGDS